MVAAQARYGYLASMDDSQSLLILMMSVTPLCHRYRSLPLMWILPVILECASNAHDASDTVGYRATDITNTAETSGGNCLAIQYSTVLTALRTTGDTA